VGGKTRGDFRIVPGGWDVSRAWGSKGGVRVTHWDAKKDPAPWVLTGLRSWLVRSPTPCAKFQVPRLRNMWTALVISVFTVIAVKIACAQGNK
jgi:hypothetical protein